MRERIACGIVHLGACAGLACAQTATFEVTGSAPGGFDQSQAWGVSADGSTVVGWTGAEVKGQAGIFGFRFAGGSLEVVPEIVDRDIFATSADARTIVGNAFLERPDDPGNFDLTAWVWVEGQGVIDMFSEFPGDFSVAHDVSSDGQSIVGMTNFFRDFGTGDEFSDALLARPDGTMHTLNHLPGMFRAEAIAVSADGSRIVGYERDPDGFRLPVWWDMANDGIVRELPPVAGSLGSDIATAISENGRFVAGFSLQFFDPDTFEFREDLVLWDLETQTARVLSQTPGGFVSSIPSFVSDDGQTVLGTWDRTGIFDLPEGEAFIWTASDGLARSLEDYLLSEQGLEIPDWELRSARDASPDGGAIVGHALSADRSTVYGYVVHIGGTCPADLDGDGDADGDDFFAYLDLFSTGDPGADIDGDGDADGDDFFAYLDLFLLGC